MSDLVRGQSVPVPANTLEPVTHLDGPPPLVNDTTRSGVDLEVPMLTPMLVKSSSLPIRTAIGRGLAGPAEAVEVGEIDLIRLTDVGFVVPAVGANPRLEPSYGDEHRHGPRFSFDDSRRLRSEIEHFRTVGQRGDVQHSDVEAVTLRTLLARFHGPYL